MRRVIVIITPYDPIRDLLGLGMKTQFDARTGAVRFDKASNVDLLAKEVVEVGVAGVTSGLMEIVSPGDLETKTASDWNRALNAAMYRLNLDVSGSSSYFVIYVH